MNKRYVTLVAIVAILVSYVYTEPLGKATGEISKGDYRLEIDRVDPNDTVSQFVPSKDKNFFIKLGQDGSPRVKFIMSRSLHLDLYFSVNNNTNLKSMHFHIIKNGKEKQELLVSRGVLGHSFVDLESGDTLEIYSDTSAANDWAIMKIKTTKPLFLVKNLIMLIAWISMLIFLYQRGYVYIFISSYMTFLLLSLAERVSFGSMTIEILSAYMAITLAIVALCIALYQLFRHSKFKRIIPLFTSVLYIVTIALPMMFIIYRYSFGKSLSKEALYALFQTNSSEATSFISSFIPLEYIAYATTIIVLIVILNFAQLLSKKEHVDNRLLLGMIVLFSMVAIFGFNSLRLPNFTIDKLQKYTNELSLFKKMRSERESNKIEFNATKKEQGETYIVVIGESLNKTHMGLYGYLRDTTPNLSAMQKSGEIVKFDNVYSNHAHTNSVLEYALTEANQYNQKKYYNSPSIIEILNRAAIETYWLTNQVIYGAWDNAVSIIGTASKHVVSINKTIGKSVMIQNFDGTLIAELAKIVGMKSDKNRVIFIHLVGSHFDYSTRYPKKEYSYYRGDLSMSRYGQNAKDFDLFNVYDNTIRYNDFVVSSMIKILHKKVKVGTLLYMPDHSEEIIGRFGHNTDHFVFDMTQIPMIFSATDGYKKRYKDRYDTLIKNKGKLFSNDLLYDTLIGIFGIETDHYNPTYDLSSDKYNLDDKDALVLHGKRHYAEADNHFYWQQTNSRYLIDTNQSSRIFPARVDSVGKLKDIWSSGFRSFEVNVEFGDKDDALFRVGDSEVKDRLNLEEFITRIDPKSIDKICLDMKNIDESNYAEVLKRLEYLDAKYHIKNRAIVESSTKDKFFALFSQSGWHTSYRLPIKKILQLLSTKATDITMEQLADSIAEQIKEQSVKALSFDNSIYDFVKKYIEPKIADDIVYHTWHAPHVADPKFQDKLKESKVYRDSRVETILARYFSYFQL